MINPCALVSGSSSSYRVHCCSTAVVVQYLEKICSKDGQGNGDKKEVFRKCYHSHPKHNDGSDSTLMRNLSLYFGSYCYLLVTEVRGHK